MEEPQPPFSAADFASVSVAEPGSFVVSGAEAAVGAEVVVGVEVVSGLLVVVGAAVVVQEVIDGNQDAYLAQVEAKYPSRFLCCSLLDIDNGPLSIPEGFRAAAIPGHRMHRPLNEPALVDFFKGMESAGQILSLCLDDDSRQIAQFRED